MKKTQKTANKQTHTYHPQLVKSSHDTLLIRTMNQLSVANGESFICCLLSTVVLKQDIALSLLLLLSLTARH